MKPWKIVNHTWAETGIYEGKRLVASLSIVDGATEEYQADLEARMHRDARLIAAVPKLLEACKEMAKTARDILANDDPDSHQGKAAKKLLNAIKLAE